MLDVVTHNINVGHRKHPLPLPLSFDVPNLWGEKQGVRLEAAGRGPGPSPVAQSAPRLCPETGVECALGLSHPLWNHGELTVTNYITRPRRQNGKGRDVQHARPR